MRKAVLLWIYVAIAFVIGAGAGTIGTVLVTGQRAQSLRLTGTPHAILARAVRAVVRPTDEQLQYIREAYRRHEAEIEEITAAFRTSLVDELRKVFAECEPVLQEDQKERLRRILRE